MGISACLLGRKVRYDGGSAFDGIIVDAFSPLVQWVPVCPETECGLPAPREEMRLVDTSRGMRLITRHTQIDETALMSKWIEHELPRLGKDKIRGFVVKSRSPSCGLREVAIFDESGRLVKNGPGIFTAALMAAFPELPLEDEVSLHDAAIRERFLDFVG